MHYIYWAITTGPYDGTASYYIQTSLAMKAPSIGKRNDDDAVNY